MAYSASNWLGYVASDVLLFGEIEVVPRARFELARVGLEPTVLSVKLTEHSETYVGEMVLIMGIHITQISKNVKR